MVIIIMLLWWFVLIETLDSGTNVERKFLKEFRIKIEPDFTGRIFFYLFQ